MRKISVTLDDLWASRNAVITRAEAAAALGVDPLTITASIENGSIPCVRLGRRVVIPREKFLHLFDVAASLATNLEGSSFVINCAHQYRVKCGRHVLTEGNKGVSYGGRADGSEWFEITGGAAC